MGDVAKDLTAGTVGGAAQLIVGHPFDTIKVKLQSQPTPLPGQVPKYSGAMDAVRQTIAAEGPKGLYKGMGAPLATVAAFNAVLFTVRGQMETLLRSEPGAPLSVGQQVACGGGAGVAVSFLACPTELIKCRLQAQSSLAGAGTAAVAVKYGGPIDVAKHVLSEAGARGLFKGLVPTLAREVPGNAAMFGVYEAVKQYMAGGHDTSELGRGSLVLAGGIAGATFWSSVYPADVVKSVIQVDDFKAPKYSGSINAFKKIVATEGVKGLYKGFGPAMARSVPANAACFLAYEMISFEGRKCSSARWSSDGAVLLGEVNRECVPLDLAVKEAISKGSILDRIKSLEDRLIQLCLHTEPGAASPSKNSQMEQNATSPRMSTKGFANSFSRFRLSHHSHNHVCMDNFQVTEEKEQNPKPEPSNEGFQRKKTKKTKDEKASPKQNSLLHLRFFGC